MANTGQTINDRLNAMRYALVGQGLARTVCKATTEEIIGPKKKHIEYLVSCTNEPNVSIPQLANLLIERTQHSSWAVVFKSLISTHHLMSFGNERFTQYLATSNFSFELNDFMDRTTPQGYGMSTFVRRYAKYINEKAVSYRTLAIDLCKIRRGNDNALRTMNMDNLSKTLPIVQGQFDSLLEFDADTKDLNNGIILAAFRLLYKDLVKLYVAYQEAIINLLERYFKLSRRKTREALDMYKNYLSRMDKVEGFLKIVDAVGLDKSEMPDLTKSPASILELLEKHLAQLEAKKRGATPASPDNDDGSEAGGNKENEPPGASVGAEDEPAKMPVEGGVASATHEVMAGSSKVADASEDKASRASSSSPAPAAAAAPAAAPKKPPPARPSPITSPKVSPSASKAKADSPQPQASSTSSSERKAAPERPTMPPSRPPPPSATATPSSSSSQSQTTGLPATTSGPATSTSTKAPPASSQTKSSHAPPHPPPPSHSGAHPSPPKVSGEQKAQATINPESSQAQHGAVNDASATNPAEAAAEQNSLHEDHSEAAASRSEDSAAGHEPSTTRTCSAAVVDQQVAQDAGQPEARINHIANSVNNVNEQPNNHVVAEDEMPPPPPPIEEEEEMVERPEADGVEAPPPPPLAEHQDEPAVAEVAVAEEQVGQLAGDQADERAPRINGQNGNGSNGNNNVDGENVVVD